MKIIVFHSWKKPNLSSLLSSLISPPPHAALPESDESNLLNSLNCNHLMKLNAINTLTTTRHHAI